MLNTDLQAGQYVTLTPRADRIFEVVRVDGDTVFAVPIDGRTPGTWFFTTYAAVVDDEPDTTCRCGHPDCGAC